MRDEDKTDRFGCVINSQLLKEFKDTINKNYTIRKILEDFMRKRIEEFKKEKRLRG